MINSRWTLLGVFVAGGLAGMAFLGSTILMLDKTESLEYCISCHEMENNVYQEYRKTIHYTNRTGVRVACADCHLPKSWFGRVYGKVNAMHQLLTGTLGTKDAFEGVRARDPDFVGSRYRRNLETVDALRRMADGYEKTVAQLAINWVAGRPGITAPIFGAKRPSQVAENVGAIGWTITEDDLARIDLLIGGLGVDT